MKTFSFSPLFITGMLVASITGCAATAASQQDSAKAPMAMGMTEKGKMVEGGCAYCGMHKEGMSHNMEKHHRGMMQGKSSSAQEGMRMPAKDGQEKGGYCDMEQMGKDGCPCFSMGKKEMSPAMHKRHMEMMQDKSSQQPAAK